MKKSMGPTRRDFLAGAASLIPVIYLSGCASLPTGPNGLYSLGVASGEPRPDSVMIWTRLAPDPVHGGGMPSVPVEVAWTVAEDETFTRIVRRGTAIAEPEDAHSVHVAVTGLQPARPYWYRFVANGEASRIGRTKTAPAADASPDRVRFAIASCQHYEQGYYVAHRYLAAEDLDLVFFVGDYIYETSWGKVKVRHHGAKEARTLAGYRNRYALYKSDPDLQASHAAFPWAVTWDDHEVSDDYANDRGQHMKGADFLARRAAAYKAYWEHMPLPMSMRPRNGALKLYRGFDYGRHARFMVLDDRQYRDYQPCVPPGWIGGSSFVGNLFCPQRRGEDRSILGPAQERWLTESLDRSSAHWNVIAQQTLMAQWIGNPVGPPLFATDNWNGYPRARRRLLDFISQRKPSNPMVIGGDIHMTVVADLKPRFDDPDSPVVATEICGTSISSEGASNLRYLARVANRNPHVRYANGATRGYIRFSLERDRGTADLRGVDDVRWNKSGISTVASFAIENGRPGAVRI